MSREAFEKVFSQPPYDWPMRKNSEGQYSSRRVQWTWEGWQAAQHHSGMVSVPVALKTIRDLMPFAPPEEKIFASSVVKLLFNEIAAQEQQ